MTPAGDMVYCVDRTKKTRWHSQLCIHLQEKLGLSEPPYFLIPCYTATVDQWFDLEIKQWKTVGELSPLIARHQDLLNVIFNTPYLQWTVSEWEETDCHPLLLENYQKKFPQLWENHELLDYYQPEIPSLSPPPKEPHLSYSNQAITNETTPTDTYIFYFFVLGMTNNTQLILSNLYDILETNLHINYTLKVIDIAQYPDQAEAYQITATPTLVRLYPQPLRKIIGEWQNWDRVLQIIAN